MRNSGADVTMNRTMYHGLLYWCKMGSVSGLIDIIIQENRLKHRHLYVQFALSSLAPSTLATYLSRLYSYCHFPKRHIADVLPVTVDDVLVYLEHVRDGRFLVSFLRQWVSSIKWVHSFLNFECCLRTSVFENIVLKGLARQLARPCIPKAICLLIN